MTRLCDTLIHENERLSLHRMTNPYMASELSNLVSSHNTKTQVCRNDNSKIEIFSIRKGRCDHLLGEGVLVHVKDFRNWEKLGELINDAHYPLLPSFHQV